MWSKAVFGAPMYTKKTEKVVLNSQSDDVNVVLGAESRPQRNLPANDLQTSDPDERDQLWRESPLPYFTCAFVGLSLLLLSKLRSRRDKSTKRV